jgi:hypothetical protein
VTNYQKRLPFVKKAAGVVDLGQSRKKMKVSTKKNSEKFCSFGK